MATLTCPHCHQASISPASSGAQLTCSHCDGPVDSAGATASRWFIAHQNGKSGPYSWRALLALASRGDLDPDAMLFKEHSERWLRARSLHALFTAAPAAARVAPTAMPPLQPQQVAAVAQPRAAEAPDTMTTPAGAHRRIWDTPWVMEGLAAASISVLLGLSIVLGYYVFAG